MDEIEHVCFEVIGCWFELPSFHSLCHGGVGLVGECVGRDVIYRELEGGVEVLLDLVEGLAWDCVDEV